MIIIFHSLYFVFKFALKWYRDHVAQAALLAIEKVSKKDIEVETDPKMMMPLDPEECFVFATPVYRQRYSAVQDLLLDPRWRQEMKCVADFGCAEFGLFQYLKHLTDITHVLAVDIDEQVLNENKFKVMPLTADYLKQRAGQLVVEILIGSIADPDWRLKKVDAIVAIELIEHLYPDTLDALPYNVFGYAKPKVAVFTTPNADFNILFPNFTGFRHDDHKFEWTREQFEDWGKNIVTRFPDYSVTFSGVGKGPAGTESLGCCSQMAVFIREYKVVSCEVPEHAPTTILSEPDESFGVCTHLSYSEAQRMLLEPNLFQLGDVLATKHCDSVIKPDSNQYYKTLQVIEYPFVEDTRTSSEKILHEAIYQIHQHAYVSSRFYQQDSGCVEIPLYELIRNFESQFVTEAEIRDLLTAAKFTIVECVLNGSGEKCMCVRYNIHMDSSPSKEESDYETSEHEEDADEQAERTKSLEKDALRTNLNTNESDWDLVETQVQNDTAKDEVATPSDPLVDSGYQKSLSNAEWSPQSPIDLHFEDQFAVTKLDVNDLKDSIRARLEQSRNGKYMNNRLFSEWRRISGAAAALATNLTSPTATAAAAGTAKMKGPVASTSNLPSKRRKKSHAKKSESEESDSAKEDVKCIANELMYNSLNKLDIEEDAQILVAEVVERPNELEIPQFIVENGDLANNNRDNEGNNYPEIDDVVVHVAQIVDAEAGVMEPDPNENVNGEQNQNQDQENRNIVRIHPLVDYIAPDEIAPALPDGRGAEAQACNIANGEPVEDPGLSHASREALFDPSSQVHMDDVDSITEEYRDVETDVDTLDIIDVENIDESGMSLVNDPAIPDNNNPFPHWLLQLFAGSYVGEDHAGTDDSDEAHFYCQGDGLGVHPSIVEVDIDTSSSSSISDAAQAERTISEDDVGSLGVDLAGVPIEPIGLEVVGRMLDIPVLLQPRVSNTSNESGDEFFDTIDDPAGVPRES